MSEGKLFHIHVNAPATGKKHHITSS